MYDLWEKGIKNHYFLPTGLFLVDCTKKILMVRSLLYLAKGAEIFLSVLWFPCIAFHHDCYVDFKHFVYKTIIILTPKKACFPLLVFFSFLFLDQPVVRWNLEYPIKWNLRYIKQLWASTWTIVAHIAPCYQDKNKTAYLWLLPIQEMAFIETLKKQLWFTKNDSFVNVVINYNSLTSLNLTHAI